MFKVGEIITMKSYQQIVDEFDEDGDADIGVYIKDDNVWFDKSSMERFCGKQFRVDGYSRDLIGIRLLVRVLDDDLENISLKYYRFVDNMFEKKSPEKI